MLAVGVLSAFRRTVTVIASIDCLVFATAGCASERRFLLWTFAFRVNFLMSIFRDELKIRNVVILFIEVAMMNFVAVGNCAVEIRPHHAVHSYRADPTTVIILVKREAAEYFLRVADGLNRRHGAFDFANHFLDGERFLRRLDTAAQQFK